MNVRFSDAKSKTSISEIINYNQLLTPAAEESSSSTEVTSRLAAFEATKMAYTLETWVNRLHLVQLLDGETVNTVGGHEFDTDVEDGRTRVSKLRAFELKILEQTYKELRLSETFVTLQQANDSMLKTTINEHKLDGELSSNRIVLNDLRAEEKRHKTLYNVRVIESQCRGGIDEVTVIYNLFSSVFAL